MKIWAKYYQVSGAIFVFCGFATLILCVTNTDETFRKVATGAWLIIPPVFEFVEFHVVRATNQAELSNLKDSQEKARYVWAGFAAALAVLYLKA